MVKNSEKEVGMSLYPTLLSLTIIRTLQFKTLGFTCSRCYAAMLRNPLLGMGVGGRVKTDPLQHRETIATTIKIFSIFSFLMIKVSKINYGIA